MVTGDISQGVSSFIQKGLGSAWDVTESPASSWRALDLTREHSLLAVKVLILGGALENGQTSPSVSSSLFHLDGVEHGIPKSCAAAEILSGWGN